jgi:putative endonuclease
MSRTRAHERVDRAVVGRRAEQAAARYLHTHGYRIIDTNVRFPVGELDLIAWDGSVLCFVEVRSVSSEAWGGPLETITSRKRRRVIRAAQWYLQGVAEWPDEMRFDVVAVQWSETGEPSIELVKDAFLAS